MSISLKIATASINTTALDITSNLKLIKQAITQATVETVDILLLPELAISGYGCEDLFFSTEFVKQCTEALLKLPAIIPHGMMVAVGVPWFDDNQKLYNTCVLLTHNQILAMACKQHLARSGVHYEPRWFEPWPAGKSQSIKLGDFVLPCGEVLVEINGIKIGFEICEDAWVEQRPGQRYADAGVDILLNPSASHFAIAKYQQRYQLIQQASAQFNCVYAYCNLLGCEAGRTIYDGGNMILNQGKAVAIGKRFSFKALHIDSAVLLCKPHPPKSSAIDTVSYQLPEFAKHKHQQLSAITPIEVENALTVVLQALALGLWDWQRKTQQKGYVISLSGGADSALCACAVYLAHALAITELDSQQYQTIIRKLGIEISPNQDWQTLLTQQIMPKVLTTVYQKSANSGQITEQAAQVLAQGLSAKHHQWDIAPEINSIQTKVEQAIGRKLSWQQDDLALQNIQARIRAPGVWMLANIEQKLLVATSNLSEASVGYCTMDGDTAGVLAPIGGISKSLVLKLNTFLCEQGLQINGQEFRIDSLQKIIHQQPTAELRPTEQNDETDLMPYEVLDAIRHLAQVENYLPYQIIDALMNKSFDTHYSKHQLTQFVEKYFNLYSRNQWKRERLAVSFHIEQDSACPKTFRRYPVINNLEGLS